MYYELYMDEFFLENFCLDFLLLFLTGIAAKLPIRFGRMAVGAAFGSLCSCLLLFLFPGEGGLLFPAALAMALLMVKGSYQIPFGQRKRLLRSTAVFFGMAFLLGGVLPVLRHPSGDPFRHRRYGSDLRCPAPEGEVEIRDGESYGSHAFLEWETEETFRSSGYGKPAGGPILWKTGGRGRVPGGERAF